MPKTSGNAHLTTVDMNTGEIVEQRHITSGESLTYREAEGMAIQVVGGKPRLCCGFAGGEPRVSAAIDRTGPRRRGVAAAWVPRRPWPPPPCRHLHVTLGAVLRGAQRDLWGI
ncbi:hypothetical protein ABZ612_36755 [Streptomyces avermitilis]|uniref:hypothetical protein n=1 Tax=Streptomyces avermitilis TaxID=33903 RepID=UPI0033E1814E